METTRLVIGWHAGLFTLLAEALSLIDLRDDLDSDVSLDELDLLEALLINLPCRDVSESLPDLYVAVGYIHNALEGYDLQSFLFNANTFKIEVDGDHYFIYQKEALCH